MIALKYFVTCDNCKLEKSKQITFQSVQLLLDNPKAKTFFLPALPKGWLTQPAKKAGEPEQLFCTPECKKEWNKKTSL